MFQGRQPTNAEIASLLGLGRAPAPSMARPQFSFPAPRFVPTGTIKPTPKTIAGSIQATIAKGLQKVGMGERRAHQFAARTMLPLTDATPVGNVTGAEEGKNTFKRGLTKGDLGTMALGAGSFLLSAAPLPGAVKRGGKKLGTGMFGSMLKDKSGAIRAWHGSPHDFDKFEWSPRTRGTGEGAQAYGDGLYFAENKTVADEYRRALAEPEFYVGGQPFDRKNASHIASREFYHADGDVNLAKRRMVEQAEQLRERAKMYEAQGEFFDASAADHMLGGAIWLHKNANKVLPVENRAGRLYEVNINAEPEDFLDWDAPLSGQNERVRSALEPLLAQRFGPPESNYRIGSLTSNPDGQKVFRELASSGGHLVEQRLLDAGVPGLRFLDQGSRGATNGTRNIVMFDDSLIDILNKF